MRDSFNSIESLGELSNPGANSIRLQPYVRRSLHNATPTRILLFNQPHIPTDPVHSQARRLISPHPLHTLLHQNSKTLLTSHEVSAETQPSPPRYPPPHPNPVHTSTPFQHHRRSRTASHTLLSPLLLPPSSPQRMIIGEGLLRFKTLVVIT